MLVKSCNDHASKFQMTTCMYFFTAHHSHFSTFSTTPVSPFLIRRLWLTSSSLGQSVLRKCMLLHVPKLWWLSEITWTLPSMWRNNIMIQRRILTMGQQPPSSLFSGSSLVDYHLTCCLVTTNAFCCCPLDQLIFFRLWRKHGVLKMASFGISKTSSMMYSPIFATAFIMRLKQHPQSIRSHCTKWSNIPCLQCTLMSQDWMEQWKFLKPSLLTTWSLLRKTYRSMVYSSVLEISSKLLIDKVSLSLMHDESK